MTDLDRFLAVQLKFSEQLSKQQQAYAEASLKAMQAFVEGQAGVRDALLLLATAVAQQENINAQKLLDEYSALIEINHPDNVPVSVLDVRAALAKVARGQA